MKPVLPLLLAAMAATAMAEPFAERVRMAKAAEIREEFKAYQAALFRQTGSHLDKTMRTCFAAEPSPEMDNFVLIADINPDGEPRAVEVSPATNIARCFALGFASAFYPRPPRYPGRQGFPVTIEMRIAP